MLNFLEELLLFLHTDTRTKSSGLSSLVVGLIFIAAMVLVIFELNWLLSLLSLTTFLAIFSVVGLLLGFLLYLSLAKSGLVEPRWKAFWIVLISGQFITVSLSSRLNRSGISDFKENEQVLVLQSPIIRENIALIDIKLDNTNFTLRTQPEKGKTFEVGEITLIKRFPGKLGFEVIKK